VAFREMVWSFYREHGRRLPWRETRDPYRILVSEFMLQQTQVARVTPKYLAFVDRFPDVAALAAARFDEVLALWSGLGYQRRALWLKRIADTLVRQGDGTIPRTMAGLRALPGVGPATAAAVAAFAYGEPHPLVETNIRTAILAHFGGESGGTSATLSPRSILALVDATLDREDPRNWYYALMDYGSALKKKGEGRLPAGRRPSEPFAGSRRALRAAAVRVVLAHPGATCAEVATLTAQDMAARPGPSSRGGEGLVGGADPRVGEVLGALVAEGFLTVDRGRYRVAGS
jgi:A/G-specific adenine glycosylase